AEAATQVRDDFLSVAAHELKTPITGLRAISQLLARRMRKRQITEYPWLTDGLATLDQQSDRLARLIGQLLDVSRLDKDNQPVERSDIDLRVLAQKLVASFRARTAKHTFALAADGELIVEVDPTGVEQVLSNLLDNAIKYSPDGGQIEIAVERDGDGCAYVSVRDHGIGIPPEKRGEIFDRFFRAHAEDHRSGLGLGLYISRQIVALHGGAIAVEFPSDGGTRFVVRLPVTARTLAPMPQG
ncbi:MAG: sensor histidine kinase, partial [Ktedonobacterales bacterium]